MHTVSESWRNETETYRQPRGERKGLKGPEEAEKSDKLKNTKACLKGP